MNKIKQKTLSIIILVMIIGIFTSLTSINAASDPNDAPADWAFEASSIELNDAIIAKYPSIDTNGDGFISVSEAHAYTGYIDLRNRNITGTINGIENFINIPYLSLRNNQFSGEIPTNINNLSELTYLELAINKFTGSIPASIGDMDELVTLALQSNQLSGSIPDEIGDLINLYELYLSENKLTGVIPSSFGNLTELTYLYLTSNQISGSIPSELGNLNKLEIMFMGSNNFSGTLPVEMGSLLSLEELDITLLPNLNGDVSNIFATTPNIKFLGVYGSSTSQIKPENPTLEVFLHDVLNVDKTGLANGITQEDIDRLYTELEVLKTIIRPQGDYSETSTSAFSINVIFALEADLKVAQDMIYAKDKVSDLLTTPDLVNLKDGVDKSKVDEAQIATNKIPDGELKKELQKQIDTANNLLNAKDKTDGLINSDGSLGAGVDQSKINDAQNAVYKLPDGTTKTKLQKIIDTAQSLLDEKLASKVVDGQKPISSGTSTKTISSLSTSDQTNQIAYFLILMTSIISLSLIRNSMKQKAGK